MLLPHREDVKIEHVEVAQDYLVSFERRQGLQQAVIYSLPGDGSMPGELGEGRPIAFDEPAYELTCGSQVGGVRGGIGWSLALLGVVAHCL